MNKNENKNNKTNKILKITALLGLFLLVFGVSYALFSVVLSGTKKNRITSGNLSLDLVNEAGNTIEGETIGLTNAIPVANEEGLTTTPYTFTIVNNGNIDAEYTLTLEDLALDAGEERLEDKYVKTHLVITNETGNTIESTPILLSTIEDRILDAGVISPGKSRSYKLYMWLDAGATNEAMNKVFSSSLKLDGIQVNKTTDERTILRRINTNGTNDIIRTIRGQLRVTTAGYTSATIYKDGTIRFNGEGSATFPNDFELYDEERYVNYHRELLTSLGFDVSSLTTKEEIDSFINSNDIYTVDFEDKYNAIWTPIITEAGADLGNYEGSMNYIIDYYSTTDIEICKKLINAYMEKTGIYIGEDLVEGTQFLSYFVKNVNISKSIISTNISSLNYIENITLEKGITTTPNINSYLLTNLTIPNTVTTIASMRAPNMTKITIPNSVTTMKFAAFNTWTSAQTINVDNTQEATSSWANGWSGKATVNYLR